MSTSKNPPLGYWRVIPAGDGWRIANGKQRGPYFASDLAALAECTRRNDRWVYDEPKPDRGDAA